MAIPERHLQTVTLVVLTDHPMTASACAAVVSQVITQAAWNKYGMRPQYVTAADGTQRTYRVPEL